MLKPRALAFALVLAVASAGLPSGASAHGTSYPYHRLGAVQCVSGGIMRVYPPAAMAPTEPTDFRSPEQVFWSPDLYRKVRRGWRLVRSGPIFFAFTSSYGFYQGQLQQAWHDVDVAGSQVLFHPFTNLRAGRYRVKHFTWWDWFSEDPHVQRRGSCTFY
jgi:hypothetical protein